MQFPICSRKYEAAHTSGPRSASDITMIVLHSTEGDTAAGAAAWFANSASVGSANLVVDDKECFLTVPDLVIPWAAPPCNTGGFHVEFAGHAVQTNKQWKAHDVMLHRAAEKIALRCKKYNIPVKFLSVADLKAGRTHGITSHNNISLAFHQSTHTDPGPGFPYTYLCNLVKKNK